MLPLRLLRNAVLEAAGCVVAGASTAQLQRPAASPPAIVEVRVQAGDTLIGLLREHADWSGVQRDNRVADPKKLQPGSVLRIPLALLREQPTAAEVVHAYGDVTVTRAGTLTPLPLAAGQNLADGDVVRTGTQSSATLRFSGGARVLVRPDSELKVERLTQSRAGPSTTLKLERGSADSAVPPAPAGSTPSRYEMRTPQTHLGVRGTEFRTTAEASGAMRVEVLEGRVGARHATAQRMPRTGAARAESLVAEGFGMVGAADGSIAPARALPEAPALAGLPERVERMPLRIGWRTAQPTRVRAQVFAAGDPPRLVLDGVFDTAPARWSQDIPDGRYELSVRAVSADGLEGRDTRTAFVLDARPEPPFAAAPAAASRTIDERVRLAWTRNAAAPKVRLQVADTSDFRQPRIDRSGLDASEIALELPLGTHHWRVASIAPDGDQGPFGDAQHFTRIAPPPAPPPATREPHDGGLLLRWPADATPGTKWQVQIARDAAFAANLLDATVSEPQVLLRDPAAGTYHVRVKTIDADGFAGPYGQPQQVEVPHSKWWWLVVPALLWLL